MAFWESGATPAPSPQPPLVRPHVHPAPQLKHIVVLMLENRSFDHMLGRLPNVSGPAGRSNVDPKNGERVPVTFDADGFSPALPDPARGGEMFGDPHHDVVAVNRQLFESADPPVGAPVTCGGFIAAGRASGDADADRIAREVMQCFDTPTELVTMTALAKEFVVCDQWFASVPGPTWPNRLFVHAATSDGHVDNTFRLYDMPTIYDRLDAAKVDWAIYYHDIPQSACLHELVDREDSQGRRCMRSVDEFYRDARRHTAGSPGNKALPSYVFIEPGYFEPARTILGWLEDVGKWLLHLVGFPLRPSKGHPNDQHAPHDVRLGEHLIADVYEALRANEDVWQHSLLIVLHDEHGGLYDHEAPGAVENPDGKTSASPRFDFDRLGLRVPAILVSPFLTAQTESTVYEHASIVRTVREHFCGGAVALNRRDASATPLRAELFASAARTDAPRRVARPMAVWRIPRFGDPETRPVSDLHATLVELAGAVGAPSGVEGVPPGGDKAVSPAAVPASPGGMSEAEGHRFVRAQIEGRMEGQ